MSTNEPVPADQPAPLHDTQRRTFASDNYSGVHPDILAALAAANGGHQSAYGADEYTRAFGDVVEHHFGGGAVGFPVFNGTGANVTALQALLPRWGAVICAEGAHINVDENGAPERVGGMKLLPVPTPDGKLTPELIEREAWGFGFEHRAQPAAVSLTQSTELGTLYTVDELTAIVDHAHAKGLKVHMDGARLSNAAAALDLPLRAFTRDVGVDIVSWGGTKNGMMLGEAVVVTDPGATEIIDSLKYLRKMNMQLGSKMRFISAQLTALYGTDLWLRSARHANAMAARLRAGVDALEGVEATQPTHVNAVFAKLDPAAAAAARQEYLFYDWDEKTGEVRWMCSFDTTEEDVDAFLAAIQRAVG
ncbi:threonine aldolase family protein [Zhihengliuella flava]|uniref:Threonine aldolase n=1 Tax=Zhihengliuella flava TaxID=1285193 RepID=A0A931DC39_9MICC|nr:threonine aldolase [Zhihengliuella flava]